MGGGLLCRLRVGVGRFANRPYGVRGQREGRGRGWKVPDGCAGRRLRLYRCVLSATADAPHRCRLCDSPVLLRGCGGDARESRCGAVSTTRSARPYGDMGAWTLCAAAVWHSLSEGYDGGVSGHDGPVEQHDAVLDGVARGGEGGAPGECSAHLALALGKGMPVFVRESSIAGHVDRGEQ